MKTVKQQIVSGLLIGLTTISFGLKAQSIQLPGSAPTGCTLQVGLYINAHKNVMLYLGSKESKRLSIQLKDPGQNVLYRSFVKGGSVNYSKEFNFEEAQSGVYELVVSDGSQTIVRKVEVVDVPAVAPQRFITYGPQVSF